MRYLHLNLINKYNSMNSLSDISSLDISSLDKLWEISFDNENIYNTICKNCTEDNNDFIEKNGFVICTKCGLILRCIISDLAEWGNYTDTSGISTNNSRCGYSTKSTDINPYISPMTSFIPKGVKNVCYKDGKLIKYDIAKVHIQNATNHLQKSFCNVEDILENITDDKYSDRIVSTAKILWAEIMKSKKITRAGVRKGLIACCLYYSCVHHDCTRSPAEICSDFGMKTTKYFNRGDQEFKETIQHNPKWGHLITKTSNSEDYFNRFTSILENDHIIKEGTAFQLAKECKELYESVKNELIGLFPKSVACGILYHVCILKKINITKTKISECLGICNPTLTKTMKTLYQIIPEPKLNVAIH